MDPEPPPFVFHLLPVDQGRGFWGGFDLLGTGGNWDDMTNAAGDGSWDAPAGAGAGTGAGAGAATGGDDWSAPQATGGGWCASTTSFSGGFGLVERGNPNRPMPSWAGSTDKNRGRCVCVCVCVFFVF